MVLSEKEQQCIIHPLKAISQKSLEMNTQRMKNDQKFFGEIHEVSEKYKKWWTQKLIV